MTQPFPDKENFWKFIDKDVKTCAWLRCLVGKGPTEGFDN